MRGRVSGEERRTPVLAEDPALVDRALYRSIVGAVAEERGYLHEVARAIGRPQTALGHPFRQLLRSRFLVRLDDVLRPRRPLFRVADSPLHFHLAVVRPDLARFEGRRTREAWVDAEDRFRSQVLGPHLEAIARSWVEHDVRPETIGGTVARVGFSQVSDPVERRSFELDVVALGTATGDGRRVVLAIGEAKASAAQLAPTDPSSRPANATR